MIRASLLALVALAGCNRTIIEDRNNVIPTAVAGGDRSAGPGEDIVFDGSASTDADGRIISYLWTFPDTEVENIVVTRAFDDEGSYVVVLEVRDDLGATSRAEILVDILVGAPNAVAAASDLNPELGATVVFDARASSADDEIASVTWRFGDGAEANGELVEHAYESPGAKRVTLTLEDVEGRRGTAQLDLVVRGVDVDGTYDLVISPSTFACAQYTASYAETELVITTVGEDLELTFGSGQTFTGSLDGNQLLASAAWVSETGGSCISAPVDGNLNATVDAAGHFTGFVTAFYDLPVPCQCSALFQLEATRR